MNTYIIGEVGINHNGETDIAKRIIDIAVDAGCNAVKFQKRNPDKCVPEHQKNVMRDTPWGSMTYLEYKHKIEFKLDQYKEIDEYCRSKNIDWFASAWDLDSQEFLQQFNLKYNKVASAMITNIPLLNKIAEEGKKTFISTGMSSEQEIDEAIKVFELLNCPYSLMVCTSTYPCAPEECNIMRVKTFKDKYKNSKGIGYSSHSTGILAPSLAVAFGAEIIEVHITSNRTMYGTDQAASLEPHGLELLCRDLRNVKKMLGDGQIKMFDSEILIKKKLRG